MSELAEVHIFAPEYVAARRMAYCSTCKCRCRHVQLLFVYYDALWYCTGCGEDGLRNVRFKRITSARRQKIAKAKRLYEGATGIREAMKAIRKMVESELTGLEATDATRS